MAAMQQQPLSKTTPPPLSQEPGSRSLEGKVVIVTGGTSGLGRCIAIKCAAAGARGVLVTGRDAARGAEVCDKINREWGGAAGSRAAFRAVDLANEAAASIIMDAAVREFGTVDLLVNSAAACFPRGDLETTTPELWDTMMKINVKAPFLITQALARHLKQRRARGAVVNIGSCAAHGRELCGNQPVSSVAYGENIAWGARNLISTQAVRLLSSPIRVRRRRSRASRRTPPRS